MKKTKLIISALVLMLSFVNLPMIVNGQDINEKISRHFTRAEVAYKMGKRKDAIKEYEQVMSLKPDNKDAYYNAAFISEQIVEEIDYLKLAIKYYQKYIELVPSERKDITKKIYELEYLIDKYSVLGIWKTTTGAEQPNCKIKISPFEGNLRIELLPESYFYSKRKFNTKVVYVNIYNDSLYNDAYNFTFVKEINYVPLFAKWKILSEIGNMVGGSGADIGSQIFQSAADIGAEAGQDANRGWKKEKFYQLTLLEEDDALTGYLRYYVKKTKYRTNSTKILYDEIVNVKFVRAPDNYDKNKAYKTYGQKWKF